MGAMQGVVLKGPAEGEKKQQQRTFRPCADGHCAGSNREHEKVNV